MTAKPNAAASLLSQPLALKVFRRQLNPPLSKTREAGLGQRGAATSGRRVQCSM